MRVIAQILSQRRIRRYFVLPLKTAEKQRDFGHVRFTLWKMTGALVGWNVNMIVLCRDKNNAVVEMTLPEDNTQIFASKYETVLPSKEALQRLLEEQMSDEDGSENDKA